jgi:cyclase
MLKTRIIPVVLYRGHEAFKGKGFKSWRSTGSAISAVKVHARRQVDELILLDISATPQGKEPDFDLLRTITSDVFMPLAFGGGIRTVEHVRLALANGADKVCLCTAALETPELITAAAERFGRQAVTVCIDVTAQDFIATHAGCNVKLRSDPVEWARTVERLGAGEILLQSIPRDGTLEGYDIPLIMRVAAAVSIPVVASSGAGSYDHLHEALKAGAHAVAAGALWDFTSATPGQAALYLHSLGIPVRLDHVPEAARRSLAQ